ncbi:MAG: sugar phosphate isomerase/epimerase [Defluviitaleaceae bacterium]|nr:sugar phosphate isomerase/epimerase [Defluviitaleaceae bacterium]
MRFGYCMNLDFMKDDFAKSVFDSVAKAGFDYVELSLSAISELPEAGLLALKEQLKAIPCKACNLFFPQSLTIVGENMDMAGIRAYLGNMLPLMADMGVETLVFGNGGARQIPPGATAEAILQDLRTLVEVMDEYAGKHGVVICVEPLSDTNTITTYGEAARLTAGLKNVAAMVDSFHAAVVKQDYNEVLEAPDKLKHLHTAYPLGRYVPSPQDHMWQYASFVNTVKQVGYHDKISIEGHLRANCAADVYQEIANALQVLKNLFA